MATRLYVDTDLAVGQSVPLPDAAFHHLVQVLRARHGDPVVLFNGRGGEYPGVLDAMTRRSATVVLQEFVHDDRESPLQLMLAQAVSKGDRMDYTLQKSVELGVSTIQPLISERSVVKLDAERWEKKHEHWRGVVIAACEQSGRNRIPDLRPVIRLQPWLEHPLEVSLKLTLAPLASTRLREIAPQDSACLLIGPEGGLSETEIRQAQATGFLPVKLGPRVLRTETAGVAALSSMQALWGDLG